MPLLKHNLFRCLVEVSVEIYFPLNHIRLHKDMSLNVFNHTIFAVPGVVTDVTEVTASEEDLLLTFVLLSSIRNKGTLSCHLSWDIFLFQLYHYLSFQIFQW